MATAAKDALVAVDHEAVLREIGNDPIIALTDKKKSDALVAAIEALAGETHDVKTKEGRKAIKADAERADNFRLEIRRARLAKTKEWRDLTDSVNEQGKLIEPRLAALHDRIRLPLTKWEEGEEARKQEAQAIIDDMVAASVITVDDTSASVKERLDRIRGRNLSDEMFGVQLEQVVDLRDSTVATLLAAIERIKEAEANAAELKRLQEQEATRLAEEAERKAQEEAQARAAEEAKRAAELEEQRKADEAAKIEREREEAAEKAKREVEEAAAKTLRDAEEKARREKEEAEAAAAAEVAAAQAAQRAAEQEAYARSIIQHISQVAMGFIGGQTYPYVILLRELDEKIVIDESFGALEGEAREALEKARDIIVAAMERDAAKAREEEETARRQANQAHRTAVKTKVKQALMTCGTDEETARKIVLAIQAGEVPHVTLTF